MLYVRASTRVDLDVVAFIGEEGIEKYDVFNVNGTCVNGITVISKRSKDLRI